MEQKGIRTFAAHLKGKNSYDQEDYQGGTAFLIGNEGNGLTEEAAEAADCLIRIPMCGKVESLNAALAEKKDISEEAKEASRNTVQETAEEGIVLAMNAAMAAGILMYEAARQRR